MAKQPEKVEGFKCLEGTIHSSLLNAAKCNVQTRIADHITNRKDDPVTTYAADQAEMKLKEFKEKLPEFLFDQIMTQEIKIVAFWIANHPEFLETTIHDFLEESATPLQPKAEKEA